MDKNQNKYKKYWEERFVEIEKSQNKTGLDAYREIEQSFDKAQRNVQAKIDAWVARFANNNNLSMADAKRLLSSKELKEFKWDVEEYIKYGQQNAFTGEWMKVLENASARYHISRLESLKIQMQHELEMVFGNELDVIDQMAKKVYNDGYYKSLYEVQRGFNLGWGVFRIDENKLDKLIGKPWAVDGKNFSSRVWQSKKSMVNELHSEFIRTCVTGKSPDDAIRHLTKFVDKKFKNAKVQAGRLVMTEQAYFASIAQKDAFNELDVEEFEIVATLDSRTSETCRDLDGQHFPMKDYQAGVTAPPFHVWCRSTTVPWFEDDYGGQRSARGEDGKTYYVPSNMTYREWEKTFVSDDGVANVTDVVEEIKLDDTLKKFKQIYEEWDGSNVKEFATRIVNSENLPLKVQRHQLKGANGQCAVNYQNSDKMQVSTYELHSGDERSIEYQVKTAFHELFHAKSNGLPHGIGYGAGETTFREWAYMDDVFAESTAHFINKSIGISKEISPSYAGHLIETLPKLKHLPEFKDCKTIADFGGVAYKYRFSNELVASWKPVYNAIEHIDHNLVEYSKSYIDYIMNNKESLIDQLLENAPSYAQYKSNMLVDLEDALDEIGNGYYPKKSNQKFVFDNALIISMNRLGVK